MSSGRHAFKLSDTARLVKAAILGGLPADRLRVVHDPVSKTVAVEVRGASGDEAIDASTVVKDRIARMKENAV
jgi:hypothetical protein